MKYLKFLFALALAVMAGFIMVIGLAVATGSIFEWLPEFDTIASGAALLLVGFTAIIAALTWAYDILYKKRKSRKF